MLSSSPVEKTNLPPTTTPNAAQVTKNRPGFHHQLHIHARALGEGYCSLIFHRRTARTRLPSPNLGSTPPNGTVPISQFSRQGPKSTLSRLTNQDLLRRGVSQALCSALLAAETAPRWVAAAPVECQPLEAPPQPQARAAPSWGKSEGNERQPAA